MKTIAVAKRAGQSLAVSYAQDGSNAADIAQFIDDNSYGVDVSVDDEGQLFVNRTLVDKGKYIILEELVSSMGASRYIARVLSPADYEARYSVALPQPVIDTLADLCVDRGAGYLMGMLNYYAEHYDVATGTAPAAEDVKSRSELESMTIVQLDTYAEDRSIDLHYDLNKAGIVNAILDAQGNNDQTADVEEPAAEEPAAEGEDTTPAE